MKVTRKRPSEKDLKKVLAAGPPEGDISPSLMLHGLDKEMPGLKAGAPFEAHIKGKCHSYECREGEGGKKSHHYDLDIHDFEPHGKEVKQKESTSDQVDKAFKKYDKDRDKEETEKKQKAEKK